MKFLSFRNLVIILILFNIVLASRWILDGNIFFHTDIARDFLLLEDIADNKNPALIGPRSGAIPGLFHGPLWLYLNLPAFFLGGGDPVVVGWFWVLLYILSIGITYYVGKRLFGEKEGQLAALLLSSVTVLNVRSLFNPYGALILFPLFFYFLVSYTRNQKIINLILTFFILGLIIQFQMAFGVPILILTTLYLIYFLFKKGKLFHLLSSLILIIPLSTFLVFELRNGFIQFNSIKNYLLGAQSHGKLNITFFQLAAMRIKEMTTDGLGIVTQNNAYLTALLLVVLIAGVYTAFKKKDKLLPIFLIGIFFYLGFWGSTILFNGPVWNYYYLPFIPLLILIFIALGIRFNKIFFYLLFILIYAVNLQVALKDINSYESNPLKQDVSTWQFNKSVAEKVFNGPENEFGYFIFTPDLYGYSPRFALNFYQKRNKDTRVYPYQKKAITYLIIAPPPAYGKDPNSIWFQKNTNSKLWRSNDIRITKEPESKITFENGFVIEKYRLSDAEIKVEPNPFLIKDIFFR
jgi:4-amino-4-deoxy-L-arabinose transferase-like glycosyltransferase